MLCRFHSKHYVLKDSKVLYELEMLMHHSDSEVIGIIWILYFYFLAIFFYDSFFRLIKSEKHTHQSGFSRAVLTKKRMDLALFYLQRYIVISDYSGKFFGYVYHFDTITHIISILYKFNKNISSNKYWSVTMKYSQF